MRNADARQHLRYTISVPHGQQKFRELILYISQKCADAPSFGATKLNKILFYSDFEAFYRFGEPITGAPYRRLKNGPAPKALLPARRQLEAEGALRLQKPDNYDEMPDDAIGFAIGPRGPNFSEHRTVALRAPYLDIFTDAELEVVDYIIQEFWDDTNTSSSKRSHNDIKWLSRNDMDDIPYEAAYLDAPVYSEAEITRTRELAKEFGWDE